MNGIDWLFFEVTSSDYDKKTLEYVYNDLIDWWGHSMFNNLLHWIRDWLKVAVVRIFVPGCGEIIPRVHLGDALFVTRVKNDINSRQREVDRKQFSLCLLLCNFLKNYMSSRDACCVIRTGILFSFPRKNLSRTQLWKEEDKY